MQRLVVDTNCLLASINPRGAYFKLYELFMAKSFEWVISNEILTEYEEQVTRRYSANTAGLQELLGFLYAECCTRNRVLDREAIVKVCS